ncbi:MAG: hypothetical protein ACI9OJ_004440, partial [Myxococcota bacterium]
MAADFDAYLEKKWSSNRYNLERMRVREKAEMLFHAVLTKLGADAESLGVSATADHPSVFNKRSVDSQWVLAGRKPAERKRITPLLSRELSVREAVEDPLPQHQEAVVGLRIDHEVVEVSVRLHMHAHLDRANLAKKLADPAARTELVALLQALPAELLVGRQKLVGATITDENLVEWAARLDAAQWWSVARRFARDDAEVASEGFVETATATIAALLPIYRYVAWSEDNDQVDGATFLTTEHQRLAEAAEAPPEPAAKNPPKPEAHAPSTRGGWSYRPSWQMEPAARPETKSPRGASARVRERAAEVAQQSTAWSYSGPTRQPPESETAERSGNTASGRNRGDNAGGARGDNRPGDNRGGPRSDNRGGPRTDNRAGDNRGGPRTDNRPGDNRAGDNRGGP